MARKQELPAAVCREVFPHDPDFPQLATATDPGLMLEQFRTHLRPATGTVYHIEDCVPFRFRCRQSTSRCVLQYTLRIVDPRTGDRQALWVTGLVYARPGAAERLWHDMQAADPRREIPEPWRTFEPVGFIPDLQMAVQVFPYDRKLPNLSLVLSGAWPGLDRLLLARREAGRWHAEGQSIEPTRYRTELGAALKYTTHARDALTRRLETLHCYLKVYRNERGEQTDRLLRALAEADGRKPYGVVCPLAYLSELRTLVLEEAPGVALQHVLLQGDAAAGIDAVARAVAAFNQDDIPIAHCPPHSLADQLDDVKRAASLVQWACPRARADVRAISAAVVDGLREAPPRPIHRDLKTDHIFLSGDRAIFIDLDSVARGDPVRDPAHLFAHIAGRVGLDALSRERARATAAAFAESYFAHVPPSWRNQFSLHCAGALIEVAGGIFKRQEPHWPAKVMAAVEEAGNALSGRSAWRG